MKGYRIALRPWRKRPDDPRPSEVLDDIVVRDTDAFRAEMMDDKTLWMCCRFPGTDERLSFYVTAVRRRGEKMHLEVIATEFPRGEGFTYEDES